jgi:hypothetical protein
VTLGKLLVLAACIAPAWAQASVIRLDSPGALEAIEAGNPDHHRRIVGILEAAQEMPCDRRGLERAAVSYHARDARCSLGLLTSYPAKRRLSFVLDDTAYVATVTVRADARLMKAVGR